MKKSVIFKSRIYIKIFNNTLKIANKRHSLIKIIREIKNTIKLKLVSNIAVKVELFFLFFWTNEIDFHININTFIYMFDLMIMKCVD